MRLQAKYEGPYEVVKVMKHTAQLRRKDGAILKNVSMYLIKKNQMNLPPISPIKRISHHFPQKKMEPRKIGCLLFAIWGKDAEI